MDYENVKKLENRAWREAWRIVPETCPVLEELIAAVDVKAPQWRADLHHRIFLHITNKFRQALVTMVKRAMSLEAQLEDVRDMQRVEQESWEEYEHTNSRELSADDELIDLLLRI